MRFRHISVLSYVILRRLNLTFGSGDMDATITGSYTARFFPVGRSQRINVSRRSGNTNRLNCLSPFCLYFSGHRAAVT
ncbi:hypothetical protein TNCV_1963831 [Trichonephila clavipes]|nr:hypothetical protein TNCV_1963831 [Trichonephila clavipes]